MLIHLREPGYLQTYILHDGIALAIHRGAEGS